MGPWPGTLVDSGIHGRTGTSTWTAQWRSQGCALGSHLFTDPFFFLLQTLRFKKCFLKEFKKKRLWWRRAPFSERGCAAAELRIGQRWARRDCPALSRGPGARPLSCTCGCPQESRFPRAAPTIHVFLNPTPSTEDVI